MQTVLKLTNLVKEFGTLAAVNGVSLDVKEGELFALIGPNGSGKTTIIKTIVGLLKATSGSVQVGGFDVAASPTKTKSQIGYIPDEPKVWNRLTGEEFLNLVGVFFGMNVKQRKQKIQELLKIYDLEGVQKGFFENYSRGNKQKFSILASLMHDPKLLVIDEPIVGLDPKSTSITKKKLQSYVKNKGTVFLATHILDIAQDIATRIGVLDKGKLIAVGTLAELRKKAKLSDNSSLEDIYLSLTK